MKTRFFFPIVLTVLATVICGCEEDTPPESKVGNITYVITEEHTTEPLVGVSIQMISDDDPSIAPANRTDNSGCCTFSDVPVGTYQVTLSKPGYESKENLPLRIKGGDNPSKEITLKRVPTVLTVSPETLDFGDSESDIQKSFSIVNPNYEDLTWAVLDSDVAWIVSVLDMKDKKSGTIKYKEEVSLSVTINRGELASGENKSTIVILSDYGRAEVTVLAVGEEKVEPDVTVLDETVCTSSSATLKGRIINPGVPVYKECGFYYSTVRIDDNNYTNSQLVHKIPFSVNYEDDQFECTIPDLETNRLYYAKAFIINRDNHVLSKNEIQFTPTARNPKVVIKTPEDQNVANKSIVLNAEVIDEGDPLYIEKGFVCGDKSSPSVDNNTYRASVEGNESAFSTTITNLLLNKTYFARAYICQNINGRLVTNYSEEKSFVLATTPSVVAISPISDEDKDVSGKRVRLKGNVVVSGNPEYIEKGFLCSDTSSPSIDNYSYRIPVEGSSFSTTITDLTLNKTYYARAYVRQTINGSYSTNYSEVLSFSLTTTDPVSEVISVSETSYSSSQARVKGRVLNEGIPAYTRRGFVYGFSSNPTVENDKWQDVSGSSTAEFSLYLSNLTRDKKYYVRVYTEQNGQVFYSQNEISFTLSPVPAKLGAISISEIENSSAKASCSVSEAGDPKYTEKGFVYNKSGNPDVDSNMGIIPVDGTGAQFTARLSGLTSNTTYYVKAYIRQNGLVYYSSEQSFKTGKQNPVVNTNSATSISYTTVTLNATVTNVGDPQYDKRGFYYGTDSNPSASNSTVFLENAQGTGDYLAEITGLSEGTKYYYRAFVMQSGGTILGSVQEFTTGRKPNVTTGGVINITCSGSDENSLNWSARLYGGVSDSGDPPYETFGFVYGLSNVPTVDDGQSIYRTTTSFDLSESTRVYYTDASGFSTGVHYYIRAVARTSLGYVYGDPVEFTPTVIPPAIRTYSAQCEIYDGSWAVALVGLAGSFGTPSATGLGFVYSLNNMPTVGAAGSTAVSYTKIENQNGVYVFGAPVSGLEEGKNYYVRAYAKTPLGYTYAEVLTFKTY